MRGERDILFIQDGEISMDSRELVAKKEGTPKLKARLIKSGLKPRSERRPARYGIYGDPGR